MRSGSERRHYRFEAGRVRIPTICRIAALLCALSQAPRIAYGADIEQTQWGFDGQVVANRFNLLSVLFSNNSSQPFDGTVELRKSVAGQYVDAPLVEAVYLAPNSSRWIQFHPYSKLDWEEWTVSWGPSPAGESALPKPRQGAPSCVLLEEPDALAAGSGGAIKRFPENLFPVHLSATDGLKSVAIDHVPRWEEGRSRAFIDWIQHGGRVYILRTAQGDYPKFAGVLEPLNTTSARQRVGLGQVERHDRTRRQLDPQYVEKVLVAGRDPAELAAETAAGAAAGGSNATNRSADATASDSMFFSYQWEGDDPLLTALKKMSRPSHRWVMIHLMSLAYIALIFPGCYVIGKRREGDYRIVFGSLLIIVLVFSLGFLFVGRRGYGEHTSVHSVAIARVAGAGRYDVTQWSNAFVVDGGDYTFSHAGTGRMYSSCQDEELVRGEIRNGAEARFTADMPPFSSRAFGHRVVSAAPTLSARIETWETGVALRPESITLRDLSVSALPTKPERVLQKLILAKGANFPTEYREVYAMYGRRVYSLTETADHFELKSEIGSLTVFLQIQQQSDQTKARYLEPWSDLEGTPDQLYSAMFLPLVARACSVTSERMALDFALPEDRVQLLVYAPMPAEMFVENSRFTTQRGYVLYCLDVLPPDS
jgi:hypothetical protein